MFDEVTPNEWRTRRPFPHVVVDGAFNEFALERAVAEFPAPTDPAWKTYTERREAGKQELNPPHPDPHSQYRYVHGILAVMAGATFVGALEALTGLSGLVPDLWGGGMHQSPPGARLALHADFTRSPETGLYRRLNALLFLNRDHVNCGGALVLGTTPQVRIAPAFNRLVVFETSPTSWHGHPDPWRCETPRRSIACYYYTTEPPADYPGDRSTEWL